MDWSNDFKQWFSKLEDLFLFLTLKLNFKFKRDLKMSDIRENTLNRSVCS